MTAPYVTEAPERRRMVFVIQSINQSINQSIIYLPIYLFIFIARKDAFSDSVRKCLQ